MKHNGQVLVEGVAGEGERFMQGAAAPPLPKEISRRMSVQYSEQHKKRSVRGGLNGLHGHAVWVCGLHRGALSGAGSVIYPGGIEAPPGSRRRRLGGTTSELVATV